MIVRIDVASNGDGLADFGVLDMITIAWVKIPDSLEMRVID